MPNQHRRQPRPDIGLTDWSVCYLPMATEGTSRSKLLDAAQAEMLAKGYAATTVDQTCARTGVRNGNFYHFFPSKEDLRPAVLDAYDGQSLEIIRQALC